MTIEHHSVRMHLDEEFGHRDVTPEVRRWVSESGVRNGLICLHLVGSTGGVTTIEYEPGALADLRRALETLAPADGAYDHNARWGDGNGFSHVRSALLKTGIVLPIVDGDVAIGTWQQVVAINFDNRPRERTLTGMILGA